MDSFGQQTYSSKLLQIKNVFTEFEETWSKIAITNTRVDTYVVNKSNSLLFETFSGDHNKLYSFHSSGLDLTIMVI